MKRVVMICAIAAMLLTIADVARADWTGAATIRDEPFYVASTGLVLGDWTTLHSGQWYEISGYAVTSPFQINLEYQAGILDADIANLNTYLYPANAAFPPGHADGTWAVNFTDNDEYVFNINTAGGLTVYEYEGQAETFDPTIQWTLTGWHQTILAGTIIGNSLVVVPTGTYRPFVGDPPVNSAEVFDGSLNTEVLAYTFTGDAADIGSGDVLGVTLVPVPAAVLLGFLGFGVAGMKLRKYV